MSVSIVVPWRSEDPDRDRAWEWVRARYERLYPDWEIVTADCRGEWSKGRAVRTAVRKARGDILVVSDSDVVMRDEVLPEAVAHVEAGAPWAVPHGQVYRLNKAAVDKLYAGGPFPDEDWSRCIAYEWGKWFAERVKRVVPGGGITVLPRKTYAKVPIDHRFLGWGGEDLAWGWALETLVGEPARLNQPMWHLYHARSYTRFARGSDESEDLVTKYCEANGDREAIKQVMAQA
jgi:hypothetical protein